MKAKRVRTPNQIKADQARREKWSAIRAEKEAARVAKKAEKTVATTDNVVTPVDTPEAKTLKVEAPKLPWDGREFSAQMTFSLSIEQRDWIRAQATNGVKVSAICRSALDDFYLKNA